MATGQTVPQDPTAMEQFTDLHPRVQMLDFAGRVLRELGGLPPALGEQVFPRVFTGYLGYLLGSELEDFATVFGYARDAALQEEREEAQPPVPQVALEALLAVVDAGTFPDTGQALAKPHAQAITDFVSACGFDVVAAGQRGALERESARSGRRARSEAVDQRASAGAASPVPGVVLELVASAFNSGRFPDTGQDLANEQGEAVAAFLAAHGFDTSRLDRHTAEERRQAQAGAR